MKGLSVPSPQPVDREKQRGSGGQNHHGDSPKLPITNRRDSVNPSVRVSRVSLEPLATGYK